VDPSTAAYGAAVVALAYVVRGMAGFGSGLIAIPLLSLVFPVTTVVPVVVGLDFLASAAQGFKNWRSISWRTLLPLVPATVIGVFTAVYLLRSLDGSTLLAALGIFVLAFSAYQLLPLPELRGGAMHAAPLGFLGGLIGTLFGTGGPLYVMYFTLRGLTKEAFRASFAAYFVVDGSIRIGSYLWYGFLGHEGETVIALALPVMALALYGGGKLHFRLPQQTFKKLISVLLAASGTLLLIKA